MPRRNDQTITVAESFYSEVSGQMHWTVDSSRPSIIDGLTAPNQDRFFYIFSVQFSAGSQQGHIWLRLVEPSESERCNSCQATTFQMPLSDLGSLVHNLPAVQLSLAVNLGRKGHKPKPYVWAPG